MSKEETVQPGLTPEQVVFLMQELAKANKETILAAVAEMKKPDEYEQEKRNREKEARDKKLKQAVEQGRRDEEMKAMKKATCRHAKPDGKHTWVAQVNADGYFRPTCIQCWSQLSPIKATTEQLTQGVSLHAYPNLTMEALEKWAAQDKQLHSVGA